MRYTRCTPIKELVLYQRINALQTLFPFNGGRRFARNIVNDTVDVVYFVDDAAGNLVEDIVRNTGPVSCHEVRRRNAAER